MFGQRRLWPFPTSFLLVLVAAAFVVAMLPSGSAASGPTTGINGDYVWVDEVNGKTFYDFETGSNSLAVTYDSMTAITIPTGMEFEFYSNTYTSGQTLYYGEDGLLMLSGGVDTGDPHPFPDTTAPNGVIAPIWIDSMPGCNAHNNNRVPALTQEFKTGGKGDRWVFTYENWPMMQGAATNKPTGWSQDAVCYYYNDFSVVLFDDSDIMEFQYDYADNLYRLGASSPTVGGSAGLPSYHDITIGIEDGAGNSGVTFIATDPAQAMASALDDEAIRLFVNDLNNAVDTTTVVDQDTSANTFRLDNNDDPVVYHAFSTPSSGSLANAPGNTVYGTAASVEYTPNAGFAGTDSFTFKVDDGYDATITATRTIHVNAAPIAEDDDVVVEIDTIDNALLVLANDEDAFWSETKGPAANLVGVGKITQITVAPKNGTAVIAADQQSILFTPEPGFYGNVTLEYEMTDGRLTDTATVNITVNDRPMLKGDEYAVAAGTTTYTLDVLNNDADAFWSIDEGATSQTQLDVVAVSPPDHGTASINNNMVEYTPPAGFSGVAKFLYNATDGRLEPTAQVLVHVNAAPQAVADTYVVNQGSSDNVLEPMANDSDDYWNSTEWGAGTSPEAIASHDKGVLVGNTLLYTPAASFYGVDSFEYTITDGMTESDPATISVSVNALPTPTDDSLEAAANIAQVLDVLANDDDPFYGDALTIVSTSAPATGTVSIAADGLSLTYLAPAGFGGIVSFEYTVTDGFATANGTVTVSVSAELQLVCDDFTVQADSVDNVLDVLGNDPGGQAALTITELWVASYGSIDHDGIAVMYTPTAGFAGPDRLHYTATDGEFTDTCHVDVLVEGAAPPYPVMYPRDDLRVLEGDAVAFTSANLFATDDVNGPDAITITIRDTPINGAIQVAGVPKVLGDTFTVQDVLDGDVIYVHDGSETVDDHMQFQATDGTNVKGLHTLYVQITPVNDVPEMLTGTELVTDIDETTTVTTDHIRILDADSQDLFFEITAYPAIGHLSQGGTPLAVGDNFTYAMLAAGQIQLVHSGVAGTFSIPLQPFDGQAYGPEGSLNVLVLPENVLPVIETGDTLKVDQGAAARLTDKHLFAYDPDGDNATLVYELYEHPLFGRLQLNGTKLHPGQTFTPEDITDGLLTYRQNGEFAHTDGILVRVFDVRGDIVGPYVIPVKIHTVINAPPDTDPDGDGVPIWTDNCDGSNEHQADADQDGLGDACDPTPEPKEKEPDVEVTTTEPKIPELEATKQLSDLDRDGEPDRTDNCPSISNTQQRDLDGDGLGDVCDDDADGDNVRQLPAASHLPSDNCPFTSNPLQEDTDGDGVGDACDLNDYDGAQANNEPDREAKVDFLDGEPAPARKQAADVPTAAIVGGIGAMVVLVGVLVAWGINKRK